jgi:hypothetical protein
VKTARLFFRLIDLVSPTASLSDAKSAEVNVNVASHDLFNRDFMTIIEVHFCAAIFVSFIERILAHELPKLELLLQPAPLFPEIRSGNSPAHLLALCCD